MVQFGYVRRNKKIVGKWGTGRYYLLLVELKKTKEKIGVKPIQTFLDKARCYARLHPERQIMTAFFSASGFTPEAKDFCDKQTIGTATEFFFFKDSLELSLES